jgi:hypothetical protein
MNRFRQSFNLSLVKLQAAKVLLLLCKEAKSKKSSGF